MSALQIAYEDGLISCPTRASFAVGFIARRCSSATDSMPPVPAAGSYTVRIAFGSASLFIIGLYFLPVGDATAINFVAPLMIVGMVKQAPRLPVDGSFPFVHLERKFMHLGFHIYDVGFQSPNVDAAKPLVFATALLLVLVVAAMNLLAIGLRNHLRAKYTSSAV